MELFFTNANEEKLISTHLGLARKQKSQIWGAHQWDQTKGENA